MVRDMRIKPTTHRALDCEVLAPVDRRAHCDEVFGSRFRAGSLEAHAIHCVHRFVVGKLKPKPRRHEQKGMKHRI